MGVNLYPDSLVDGDTQNAINAAASLAARKWRVIATRGNYPYSGDGSGGQTRFESWIKAAIAKSGCSAIRVLFANTYSNDEAESVSLLSTYTLEASVTIGGTLIPFTFQGRKNPTVDPSTPLIMSDPIGVNLAADQIIELRTGGIITSGGRLCVGLRSGGSATVKVRSTSASSQIYTTATMTTPAGGSTASNAFVPFAVIGLVNSAVPSVGIWGDSIEVGIGDNSDFTTGLLGFAERGLAAAKLGFTNMSRGGDKTGAYSSATCTSRYAMFPYITHLLANMAVNDIKGGRSAATILANVDALIARCQAAGVQLVYCSCLTETTSTDSWATVANQTTTAGFEIGGTRDQVNAGLQARAAQGKLQYVDFSSLCIDHTTNKWLAGKTDDGTHPNGATHIAMGAALKTIAEKFVG